MIVRSFGVKKRAEEKARGDDRGNMPKKPKKQSIGDLSEHEAIEDIGGLDEDETPDKGKDHNPGRGLYRKQLAKFAALKDEDKHTLLRETWKEVAMGAAARAKAFVATCSPKDFGNLQRMVLSGAVAIDKAYPPKQEELAPKFIVNMFGSLGQRAAAIATPPTPIIDVTPVEVTTCSPEPTTEPCLLTAKENSTTTPP